MTRQKFFKKSILAVFFMLLVTVSGCGAIGNDSQFTQMNQAFLPDATEEAASMEEAASQADSDSMAPGEKQLQERDAAASGEDKNSGKKDGAGNTGNPVSEGKNGNDSGNDNGNNAGGSMGNEGNSSADGETGSSAGDKTEGSEDDNVDGNRMAGSTGNHVSSSEPNNNIGSNADGNGVKSNEGNNANGNKAESNIGNNASGNEIKSNAGNNVNGNKTKSDAGNNADDNKTKSNAGNNANGNKAKSSASKNTNGNKASGNTDGNVSGNKAKNSAGKNANSNQIKGNTGSNANKNKDKSSQKSNSKIHKNTAKPPATTAKPSPVKKPQPTAAPGEGKKLCTISIECKTILSHMDKLDSAKKPFVPEDGIILPETSVELQQGDTVFDILSRVCKERKIHMEASYTPLYGTYYVEGIHQLYEFDCGKDMSGWKYFVNGVSVNYSCSKYKVKPGDVICWRYTCDGGRDLEKGAAKGNTGEDIWEKSGF